MQPGATAVTVPRAGYHTIVSVFKVFLPEAAKICTRFFFCGEKKLEVSRGRATSTIVHCAWIEDSET